jgi:hypothetical protein
VLYRLYLAEKLKEPFRKGARRPDAALLAAREAAQLEAEEVCAALQRDRDTASRGIVQTVFQRYAADAACCVPLHLVIHCNTDGKAAEMGR